MLTKLRLVVHLGGIKEVDALLGGGKVTSTFTTGRRILTALVLVAFLMPLGPAILSGGDDDDGFSGGGGHHDDDNGAPPGDNDDGHGGGWSLPPDFIERVRNLIKCIITCIELTLDCRQGCTPQCEAMFPGDQPAIDECWVSCQEGCTGQRKNCVAACKFEFSGETPELP